MTEAENNSRTEDHGTETAAENKPEGQVISTREGIYRLLKRLENKHTPIKLNFDSVADQYSSMVVSVNYKEGYFLLDEVTPHWGDDLMSKAIPFHFESYHEGCRISAEAIQASGRAIKDGAPIYRVAFPKSLHFLQRRKFYRAQVRLSLEIKVCLSLEAFEEVNEEEGEQPKQKEPNWDYVGFLRDLSAQGCQVDIPGDQRENLEKNTHFKNCHIVFPNGERTELGIIVRHIGYDEKKKLSSLGCQFTDMDPQKEQKISFVVTELQRDNARAASGNAGNTSPSELFEPATAARDKNKKEASKKQKEAEETAEAESLNTQAAHQFAVKVVRVLVSQLRKKQPLEIGLAWQAADHLLAALTKERQQLLLYTRVRTTSLYLYEHSVSVATLLADQALFDQSNPQNQDKDYLRNLLFAGLCHDLGKGLIPERIFGKSGNLTPQEAKVMHKHSLVTREVLSRQQGTPDLALQVATQNCERLDGSGHPEQLKGLSITPLGKLAAVIDVFDAMTNNRSYRTAIPHALAFKRLLGMKNKLDPGSTQQLIKRQGIFPIGSLVSLPNGDLGFVKTLTEKPKPEPETLRLVFNKNTGRSLALQDIQVGSSSSWEKVVGPEDPVKYQLDSDLLLHDI